jgi:low affinity Fe/Cu permease
MPRKARTHSRKALSRNSSSPHPPTPDHLHQSYFERFAVYVAHLAGRPAAFLTVLAVIVLWSLSGPLFGFSDTWQLVINSTTTIITFLMVFLIQNTQNRDTTALQVKLDALIFATRAEDQLAAAEDMSDSDLEKLHDEYRKRAEHALAVLHHRRPARNHSKRSAA